MFEQTVLPDARSQRLRMFLLVTTAELLVLATAILLPLFWIAGPSIPKLPPVVRFRPRSMPIDVVPVERMERAAPRPSPLPAFFDPRSTTVHPRPLAYTAISTDPSPDLPAVQPGIGDPAGVIFAANDSRPLPPPPSPAPPKSDPATPKQPLRVSQGVQEAKLIHRVMPVYPKLAIQTRQFGTVRMIAVIGKDGRMRDIQVLSGPSFLVEAALEAVRQWVYKPTYLNNEPVEVLAPITVNFTLSQ